MPIFGCNHKWSFPIHIRGRHYSPPYDAHRTCTECGAERLFDSRRFVAGPLLRKVTPERQRANEDLASM
jgi:hypothetical protein